MRRLPHSPDSRCVKGLGTTPVLLAVFQRDWMECFHAAFFSDFATGHLYRMWSADGHISRISVTASTAWQRNCWLDGSSSGPRATDDLTRTFAARHLSRSQSALHNSECQQRAPATGESKPGAQVCGRFHDRDGQRAVSSRHLTVPTTPCV